MEQELVLRDGKCRRRYSPELALFDAGNALRVSKYHQSVVPMAILLEHEAQELQGNERDEIDNALRCRLFNCDLQFRTVAAYEEHYDLVHRNVCLQCYRSFLSMRLLDIHISERHDAFFKILSKRKPMYVCLVDGCEEKFTHDDKRTRHLVRAHSYPSDFSFHDGPSRKLKHAKKQPQRADPEQQPSAATTKHARRPRKLRQTGASLMDVDENSVVNGVESAASSNSSQAHAGAENEVMEDLESKMKQLQLPKRVSFGKKQRMRQ